MKIVEKYLVGHMFYFNISIFGLGNDLDLIIIDACVLLHGDRSQKYLLIFNDNNND